jgi:hypothetical protein
VIRVGVGVRGNQVYPIYKRLREGKRRRRKSTSAAYKSPS